MKRIAFFLLLVLGLILLCLIITKKHQTWAYQCVDTMKISRDSARSSVSLKLIENQIQEIKNLGANCVSIDTPYDEEFVPYLTKWVKAARKQHLKVWFRGNFSGWEGWFNYPTIASTSEELSKTQSFIKLHPTLFENGDIFTATPEAENGGPFASKSSTIYAAYRKYLIDENTTEKKAFSQINKKVTTNWLSMSGGWAKTILDKQTVTNLGNTVAIDHYVVSPKVMTDYINYFTSKFNCVVIISEFGAPIPEINGDMSPNQQANFIDKIFKILSQKGSGVEGVNYWVLTDGSTALLNSDNSEKQAYKIVKKYYTNSE